MPKKKVKVEVSNTADIDLSLIEYDNRIADNAVDIKELHDKTDKLLIDVEELKSIVNKLKGRLGI